MQIFTLLRPHILSTIAVIRHTGFKREMQQSSAILVFCLGLAAMLYVGARHVVDEINAFAHLAYLPVSQIIGLFLLVLFFTLIISNLALSIGRFYQSLDTDLLLSSPVPFSRLFFLRGALVLLSASWMPALFLLPFLLGILGANQISILEAAFLMVLLLCFFAIPTGIAITLATLILYASPTNYVRYILAGLTLSVSYALWQLHGTVENATTSLASTQGVLRMISVLSLHQHDWLPSNWIARSIEAMQQGSFTLFAPECMLLTGTTVASISVAFCLYLVLFDESLARASGARIRPPTSRRTVVRQILDRMPLSIQTRGLAAKEYILLFRDTAQLVQIALLFILSSLYLYNLETLAFASQFSEKFDSKWTGFMSITTIAIGCFFTVAVATRIIFPAVSLEGRAFSCLQSAPITMDRLLQIKFWCWFLPLGILSFCFFTLAGYAIHLNFLTQLAVSFFGIVSAYIAAGLAIGLGARFARFDWEYSTQLAASFGSVLYMLSSVFSIAFCGAILLLFTAYANMLSRDGHTGGPYCILLLGLLSSWLLGRLAVRWSIRSGERELSILSRR